MPPLQVAGVDGTMLLRDFVIPASEAGCSFELRDRVFLDALATKVQQKVQQRMVRAPLCAHACARIQELCSPGTPRLPACAVKAWHALPQHLTDCRYVFKRKKAVAVQVELPRPQEALMWEQFARDVRQVQAGGAPNEHWPRIAHATQAVVQAVYESAKNGNKAVRL